MAPAVAERSMEQTEHRNSTALTAPPTGGPKTGGPRTAGPRTAGVVVLPVLGTVIKTPWRAKQHMEMQALMASLPSSINCICEICDCGHCVHHHTCKKATEKPKTGTKQPFPITHTHDMFKGVYQPPRSSKKPPPTPRETDIPPMVFETNQRDDFIPRPISMRKPLPPPKSNFELPTDPLDGISYYMQDYPAKKLSTPSNFLNARQADKLKTKSNAKFYGDTTNLEHYKQWKPVKVTPAEDPPCYTGELLYPDKETLPLSTTRQAFPGVYAPKPQQVKAAPNNLQVGGEGDFLTTTAEVYQGKFGRRADKFVPMPKPFIKKGPLMAETQNMHDYPKKTIDRVKAVDPAQPTIDLKFDTNQCFDTEQRMIYQGHDALKHPVPKSFKKVPPAYERPSVPVEGLTVTHSVFTPKNFAESFVPLRAAPAGNFVRDLPKFDDRTANKDHYKNWGPKIPIRLSHADFADGYHPTEGKFDGTTTTKSTFHTPLHTGIPKSFKPEPKRIDSDGSFDFTTVNNVTYQGQSIKPCRAKLWIMQQKLKENFQQSRHNTPLVKA
ncbi:hypothetical protein EB796_014209 [Bugula neritina]|uniref:Stabilizer of axonemal microtubules 2 n=1 Tax=Bugula neritina TaxID=10212 RepID=A0A7J7JN68_BUGNE|nr:hypothetical protein EB796_014209 [Bugula neritina]